MLQRRLSWPAALHWFRYETFLDILALPGDRLSLLRIVRNTAGSEVGLVHPARRKQTVDALYHVVPRPLRRL